MKTSEQKWLQELVLNKYRADPEALRACLPDLAQAIDQFLPTSRSRSRHELTQHELANRLARLNALLEDLASSSLETGGAVQALEHYAALIACHSPPDNIDHQTGVALLKAAFGVSPSSAKSILTIVVENRNETEVNRVTFLRGVTMNMSWDFRLVSVTIDPQRVRQRAVAMRLVGISRGNTSEAKDAGGPGMSNEEGDAR